MVIEKSYQNCNHWYYSTKLCPERNNEFMLKTEIGSPRGASLTPYDNEQLKKLCQNCPEFKPIIMEDIEKNTNS